ncbi:MULTISPECIES: hypothetical protein [Streptomyces]|uniref:Uncharacterized protein n=1 Tax=Streptomyces caniscabiei TaxID=2746961 RepID=A0ABU4N452_9ACTN|nr:MULTISPECIES: hypothetical protein [Streptomyces]MBE4735527.1 hypothetical protein [Streptomyces caniscabiei]MBE4758140.1 hypothetical protein [Streptomyces caniscabiei]MBE4774745.1 hypothetical protein [Streptomyces caniscabiei]MBE4789503.1 hypothetical protein [Streptomyces caniscabiei]MBE4795945.1 hypothetical protein [Streptomyces caniscabiei]
MGARSFMLATRTPMSRDGFDAWLRTPLPDLAVIDNPSAMYTGWALDGADPDWDLTGLAAGSPQAAAAIRADRTRTPLDLLAPRAHGYNLIRHRDEALEVYLYDYHGEASGTQTTLLMLAGAGRFAHPGTETPVLYWGGDVHPGLPMPGDEPLAVLLVGDTRARFVGTYPLDTLITALTPVESDFLTATAEENPTQDSLDLLLDPALRAWPTPTPTGPTEHPCRPLLPASEPPTCP